MVADQGIGLYAQIFIRTSVFFVARFALNQCVRTCVCLSVSNKVFFRRLRRSEDLREKKQSDLFLHLLAEKILKRQRCVLNQNKQVISIA